LDVHLDVICSPRLHVHPSRPDASQQQMDVDASAYRSLAAGDAAIRVGS